MANKEANTTCGYCEEGFFRKPSKPKSKSGLYFCSREHQGLAYRKNSGIAVTSGPSKTSDYEPRIFNCKNCNAEARETILLKSFCSEPCKGEYINNLTSKKCASCEKIKPVSEYNKATATFDRLSHECKVCLTENWAEWYSKDEWKAKDKNNKRNRDWSKTEKGQENALRKKLRKYNLTEEEYSFLIERSQGKCEICKEREGIAIDHDHTTGKVRGILCHGCNLGIGSLGDTITSLQNALNYLLKNS